VDENCSLLGYYTTTSDNFIPTSRDNIEDGADRLYQTSVRYYICSLRNNPEQGSSCLWLLYVMHLVAIINECIYSKGLRPLACWDRGLESHWRHGSLSVVSVVCCQVEVFATSWSLVQGSPTDCGALLCVI